MNLKICQMCKKQNGESHAVLSGPIYKIETFNKIETCNKMNAVNGKVIFFWNKPFCLSIFHCNLTDILSEKFNLRYLPSYSRAKDTALIFPYLRVDENCPYFSDHWVFDMNQEVD